MTHIEWGGDIHVPHGDLDTATEVGQLTRDAGLVNACYGSYYRLASDEPDSVTFSTILATAVALGAPVIRVWAGNRDSADATDEYIAAVAADAHRIAELAVAKGVRVAFEYHGGTITDNAAAVKRLLASANHPNLGTLWQPSVRASPADRLAALTTLLADVAHVHVFQWIGTDRIPLSEGVSEWRAYLAALNSVDRDVPLLLEFVENDDPAAFLRDAATLRGWLAEL
jgi:sugar phosphate isomerase/epimerase